MKKNIIMYYFLFSKIICIYFFLQKIGKEKSD